VPAWEYAALVYGIPAHELTGNMALWTDWAGIIKGAEAIVSKPTTTTTETF
jgi:hypothetical protein